MNGPGIQGTQRGVLLALATAAISGLSVYLNAFGVKLVSDAAVYTTAKNAVAAVVLVTIALLLGARHEATSLAPRPRLGVLAIAVIGGSVPFVLFFSGLAVATAPTAAFIHKTMFIWVAFMAVPLLSERLGLLQVGALGVLLAGQALIAPPVGVGWGPGETMILAATLLWSVEVVLAKRLLAGVSAPLLAASRMGLGFVILVGYLVVSGRIGGFATLTPDAWLWVMVTGGMLSAYVITWYSALRHAPGDGRHERARRRRGDHRRPHRGDGRQDAQPDRGRPATSSSSSGWGRSPSSPPGTRSAARCTSRPRPRLSPAGGRAPPAERPGALRPLRVQPEPPRAVRAGRRREPVRRGDDAAATSASSGGWRRASRAPTRTSS